MRNRGAILVECSRKQWTGYYFCRGFVEITEDAKQLSYKARGLRLKIYYWSSHPIANGVLCNTKIVNLSIRWKKLISRLEARTNLFIYISRILYAQLNLLLIFVTRAWTIVVASFGHILKEKKTVSRYAHRKIQSLCLHLAISRLIFR